MSSKTRQMGLTGRRIYTKTTEKRDPWTMTKKEYDDLMYYQPFGATVISKSMRKFVPSHEEVMKLQKEHPDMFGNDWYNNHRFFVVKALKEGKTVPPEVLKEYPELNKKVTPSKHIWEMTKDELMYLPLFAHKFGKTYSDYYDDYKAIGWPEGWQYNKNSGYVDKTGYEVVIRSARDKGLVSGQSNNENAAIHAWYDEHPEKDKTRRRTANRKRKSTRSSPTSMRGVGR